MQETQPNKKTFMEFLFEAKGWEHAAAVLCLEVTFERGLSP